MSLVRHIYLLLAFVVLSGCASHPPEVLSLTKPAQPAEIEVKSKISFTRIGGMFNSTIEEGLVPGIYVAEQENEFGTFYRGPDRCVWTHGSYNPSWIRVQSGGVWFPRNEGALPRLYWRLEDSVLKVKDIDAYIASNKSGMLVGGAPPTDFRSGLAAGLAGASYERNKDIPLMQTEITDQAFIAELKSGYRKK